MSAIESLRYGLQQVASVGANPMIAAAIAEYDALAARLAEAERDAALGRIAMRFVDRAGDYCDVDPAERICDEFNKAMGDEVERQCRERRATNTVTVTGSDK